MSLLQDSSLLLTPSAYKEGKLYSVIPSNGNGDFTATRATTATRVNSSGLVDLVPYNLASWSEMFTNVVWTKSASSVSANTTTAPDGALTADTFTGDGTLNVHTLFQGFTVTNGVNYSWSFYAKKNTHNFIQLNGSAAGFGVNVWANFDLNNGVVGSVGSLTTASIQSVGNGWYRCTIVGAAIASTSTNINLLLVSSATSLRGESNTLSTSVFVWGAQLVEGTSARDYLRTETRLNIPRIDYSLGGCPNILLEPQRTNLALQSSSFDNAVWTRTTSTVTPNQAIAPDGTLTMDLLTFITAGTFTTQGISVTSGATYTFSVWLATQSGTQTVEIGNINVGAWQSVTVTTTPQRFEVTQVASASTRFPGIRATGAYSIFAWGAQLEQGAYATSYIPTTTASVTRNADSITRNNIFTNGLITAAGGTWFVELRNVRALTRDAVGNGILLGTTTNGLSIRNGSGAALPAIFKYISGGATQILGTISSGTAKIAFKWNGTTADVFLNGVKVVSATAFAVTNMDSLSSGSVDVPSFINEMALFPTPLSDSELISMTTL